MRLPSPKVLAYLGAGLSLILGSIIFAGKIAGALSIPDRVENLEKNYRVLSDGQIEQAKRMDMMGVDIAGLRREMEAASRRSENSFLDIMKQLATIAGSLTDVRDSARDNARDIMTVREKAANALELADEAQKRATEAALRKANQ